LVFVVRLEIANLSADWNRPFELLILTFDWVVKGGLPSRPGAEVTPVAAIVEDMIEQCKVEEVGFLIHFLKSRTTEDLYIPSFQQILGSATYSKPQVPISL
jgi:hypothetical protein